MSSVVIAGDTSGTVTLSAPAVSGTTTLTLPTTSGTVVIGTAPSGTIVGTTDTQTLTNKTLTSPTITGASVSSMASSVITSGTSVASTSGTSIDFTDIPSWTKRITVMFNGASTNGSNMLIRLGTSSSFETTGYTSTAVIVDQSGASGGTNSTAGFVIFPEGTANIYSGIATICTLGSNVWVFSAVGKAGTIRMTSSGGDKTLANTLTRIRITTVNGTDAFDAGSINILYE